MPAFYLLVPFLLIRFIFLSLLDRKATGRAAHFAPMQGKEMIAYYLYQFSTLMLLLVPFFLKVSLSFSTFFYFRIRSLSSRRSASYFGHEGFCQFR